MAKVPTKEELLKEHESAGAHPDTGGAFVRNAQGEISPDKKAEEAAPPAPGAATTPKK